MSKYKYGTPEDCIEKAQEELEKAIKGVAKIRNEVGTIMPVKMCSVSPEFSLKHYKNSGFWSFDVKKQSCVDAAYKNALATYDKLLAEVEETHKNNESAIKNNINTRQKVSDFMESIGISKVYSVYDYPTKRHKNRQRIDKRAGWSEDIDRCIKTFDNYEDSKRKLEDFKKSIEMQYKELSNKNEQIEREKQKKIEEQEDIKEFARFQVKYDCEGDWRDILDKILDKNKYLCLAHYLLMNRNDWNDGYSYAEVGLHNFSVDNQKDQDIVDCINSLIGENWDGDGRCFRDCEYSYDVIFDMVEDKKLIEDYYKVYEKIGWL